ATAQEIATAERLVTAAIADAEGLRRRRESGAPSSCWRSGDPQIVTNRLLQCAKLREGLVAGNFVAHPRLLTQLKRFGQKTASRLPGTTSILPGKRIRLGEPRRGEPCRSNPSASTTNTISLKTASL